MGKKRHSSFLKIPRLRYFGSHHRETTISTGLLQLVMDISTPNTNTQACTCSDIHVECCGEGDAHLTAMQWMPKPFGRKLFPNGFGIVTRHRPVGAANVTHHLTSKKASDCSQLAVANLITLLERDSQRFHLVTF